MDSLGINNARSLTLVSGAGAGTITNNGSIALNATVSLTDLRMSGNVTMQGTINANQTNSLTIDLTNTAGSAVNDGILKASNGGTLII